MKINDILVEAPPRTIPTKMAPGDLTKRAQQRNQPVTPSATTLPVQNAPVNNTQPAQPAPVNNTQPAQPASATSKPGSTGVGFLSGFADQMIGKGPAVAKLGPAVAKLLSTPGEIGNNGGTTGQTGGKTPAPAANPAQGQQPAQGEPQAGGAAQPAAATDANKDPQFKIFKDANAFKSEWEKYAAAQTEKNKANGMGPYQLISDTEMLTALKDMWMRSGGLRVESKQSKKALRLVEQRMMKDPIYESFNRVGRYLVEAELTQDQIKQIFQAVADGAKAGGNVQNAGDEPVNNRTLVGKGGDMVAKVAKAWDGVKAKISQSAPVAGFDQAVDAIQGKLLKAAGGESGAVGQALQKYKEFGQQHPIFQGAIYAGLIALAGISGAGLGGAALLVGIKTFDRLLQGDKASSALWRGFKAGAIAAAAGQLGQWFQGQPPGGDGIASPSQNIDPTNPDAWADGTQANGTDTIPYTVQQGETLSQIAKSNGVSVKDMMDANPDITNPDVLKTGQALQIPQSTGDYNVYDQGVGTQADTLSKIKSGEYTDSPISHRGVGGGTNTNIPPGAEAGNQLTPKSSFDAGGVNPQDQAMLANNPAIQAANSKIDAADAANYQQQAQQYMQQQIEDGANADKALTKWATSQGLDKSDLVAGIAKDENGDFFPGWSQPKGSDWYVYNPTNDPNMTYPDNFRVSTKSIANSSYVSPRAMIGEYVDYTATMRSRMLSEMRGVAHNGFYLTPVGVNAIFEGVVNEGPWDTIKNVGSKIAGGVEKFGQGVADVAKKGWDSAANKITLDKLDLNWRKNYKEFDPTGGQGPVDSEQVKAFLRKQGITDILINKVFGDLGLEQPAQTQPVAQPQASAGGVFTGGGPGFTAMFKQFSDAGGNLAPQVRGELKNILLTAVRTVENIQRRRQYAPPLLSEVRTDFSAALMKLNKK